MNRHRELNSSSSSCKIHPKEVLLGVCPLCLNERLLILASQQRRKHPSSSSSTRGKNLQKLPESSQKKPPIALPRFFAMSSSFLGLFELRNLKSHCSDVHHDASIVSPEDSFISIKFGDNGATSWERSGNVSKVSLAHCRVSWGHYIKDTKKAVIQHSKTRSPLTWRKRIGQLFHVIRLRRSTACHVSANVERVKVSRSWIWPLTKNEVHN